MKTAALTLVVILIAARSASAGQDWAVYADADSLTYCEPYTINGLFHDLEGGVHAGEVAFTFNRVEVGARYGNWQVSNFARYGYYLEFTPDTARLYYQDKNDLPLDSATTYDLNLYGSHLKGDGVGISNHWQISKSLWVLPRINLVHGSELVDGEISGQFSTTKANGIATYASTAQGNYYYSEDILFERIAERPSGKGATFDLQIGWSPTPKLTMEARIDDAWSQIRWKKAPHTDFTGDTNTFQIDSQGRLSSKPLVSGREDYQVFNQRLPVRTLLSGLYRYSEVDALLAEVFLVKAVIMPRIGYQLKLSGKTRISALYDFKSTALGMGVEVSGFKASILADSLDYKRYHMLALNLHYSLRF